MAFSLQPRRQEMKKKWKRQNILPTVSNLSRSGVSSIKIDYAQSRDRNLQMSLIHAKTYINQALHRNLWPQWPISLKNADCEDIGNLDGQVGNWIQNASYLLSGIYFHFKLNLNCRSTFALLYMLAVLSCHYTQGFIT